jgi:hypothetical protein
MLSAWYEYNAAGLLPIASMVAVMASPKPMEKMLMFCALTSAADAIAAASPP